MSYQSDNLDLEILEEGDPADLTTVSDNFDKIDAVAGDIATIETSPTQSSHAAGEFLLYEGRLYKVTSAISAGGSLILGTNVSAANIGNELKSLKGTVDSAFLIDQTPGNTWSTRIGITPRVIGPNGTCFERVSFPFITKNNNYSVTCPTFTINNIGSVTPTVQHKDNSGLTLNYGSINNSGNGSNNNNGGTLTITFA